MFIWQVSDRRNNHNNTYKVLLINWIFKPGCHLCNMLRNLQHKWNIFQTQIFVYCSKGRSKL